MIVVADKKKKHSSSYRFRPRISENINYFAKTYKRKKTSIVEEALDQYFEREKKKQEEITELRKLIQEGRDSGSTGGIPTLEEIKALAIKRYPHNH